MDQGKLEADYASPPPSVTAEMLAHPSYALTHRRAQSCATRQGITCHMFYESAGWVWTGRRISVADDPRPIIAVTPRERSR
jgi:hypothetical protein